MILVLQNIDFTIQKELGYQLISIAQVFLVFNEFCCDDCRSKEEETNPEDVVGNMQAKFFKLKNKHKLQMDAEVHKMER